MIAKNFSLADAARLAGLSLEVTNEAARVLHLKRTEDDALGPLLSFSGVTLLRALAPALGRGVDAVTAERELSERAAADSVIAQGGRVLRLRPVMSRPVEALRAQAEATRVFFLASATRYERELHLKQAEQLLRRAVSFDSTLALAWSDLGNVLWELGAPRGDCADLYRRALELDPDLVDALYTLGAIGLQEGRLDEAEKLLVHAVEVAREEPKIYALLARVYSAQGRAAEAEEARLAAATLEDAPMEIAAPG